MTDKNTCRLVELRAENFMRLSAVAIRPVGSVVEIAGANGEGKSSVLRAFWAAIEGKAALANVAPVAVKRGTGGGSLYLDLGRVKITRTITPGGEGGEEWTLKLVVADGNRRITSKPQAMLDAIVGNGLALDPMEFARWDGKRQVDALKRLVPGFDFVANAEARAAAFADRTDANREAKRARAAADSVILPDGPKPDDVDVATLVAELDAAGRHNADVVARAARRAQTQADADAKYDEAEKLRARAASLEKEAAELEAKIAAAPPLPGMVDDASIRARIAAADATRSAREKFEAKRTNEAAARGEISKAELLSEEIAYLDKAKADAIAKAKLPVAGLSFDDDGLLLNGLPFAQASTAEKIKTSMAVAMATAGDLKVVMIDEGSELDGRSLALVEEMATAAGFTVMICRVDETGDRGWVIQDGAVARTPKIGAR
jgi:hypothetical protein